MASLRLNIVRGEAPFKIEFSPSTGVEYIVDTVGEYTINDLPLGSFDLIVTDAYNCVVINHVDTQVTREGDAGIDGSSDVIASMNADGKLEAIINGSTTVEVIIYNVTTTTTTILMCDIAGLYFE